MIEREQIGKQVEEKFKHRRLQLVRNKVDTELSINLLKNSEFSRISMLYQQAVDFGPRVSRDITSAAFQKKSYYRCH